MKYIIMGDPIPLMRARYSKRCVWDAQKLVKATCGIGLRNQHQDKPFHHAPIWIDVTFYFAIPASRKNRKALIGTPHFYKPDLSNLIKFIEDVATGLLYHDDCMISHISAKKVYDEIPRTEFIITTIKCS